MTELLSWLLEEENPGVRYLALRDLKAAHASPQTLAEYRQQAHMSGKIPAILAKMNQDGFWAKPGAGYSTKYQSSVWALILLAQLGARKEEDARIATALNYYRQPLLAALAELSGVKKASILLIACKATWWLHFCAWAWNALSWLNRLTGLPATKPGQV